MMVLLMMLIANDPFARARADISVFCNNKPACITRQRSEMGYFVTMMGAFKDPRMANAARCMRAGKVGKHIDWTIATQCMRKAVKGRPVGG